MAKRKERTVVKTNSEPDLNDLFSNMAYMTAKYAAAKKDLASQLVFSCVL